MLLGRMVRVHVWCHGYHLKALMNRLFLVQTIVIVGLVVGLQRLLR